MNRILDRNFQPIFIIVKCWYDVYLCPLITLEDTYVLEERWIIV